MRLSKSDYVWSLRDEVILIEDLNLGNMSVTNDAENVITEIFEKGGEAIKNSSIIAKDMEGIWDELIPEWDGDICIDVNFLSIGETNPELAIKKVKTK